MIAISDCPDTGLKRFITAKDTLFYESAQQVILVCHISHYDSENNKIDNTRIKSYIRNLIATTDTPVNPETGVIQPDWSDPNSISEYQFFKNLKTVSVIAENMELAIIAARDLEGKFNI